MILGMTLLGVLHTAVSLVALAAGFAALIRYREISLANRLGQLYLASTFITALTAFGIFRHGGFGVGHVLAVLTILAIAAGVATERAMLGGTWSRRLQAFCYSTTLFFHLIPGLNETLSRLPPSQPLISGPQDPAFKPVVLTLLLLYVFGIVLQLRWLTRTTSRTAPALAR